MEDGRQTVSYKPLPPTALVTSPYFLQGYAEPFEGPMANLVVVGYGGVGKSGFLDLLLNSLDAAPSARSLRRSITVVDGLHEVLAPTSSLTVTSDLLSFGLVAAQPTVPFADLADRPWSSAVGLPFSSDPLILLDAPRSTLPDGDESLTVAARLHNISSWSLIIDELLILDRLQQELLRLVNRVRIALRIRLVRVLSGASRIPDAINFVLLLLAASRCYGHRTEPDDRTLPVLTSTSVVIGETAHVC